MSEITEIFQVLMFGEGAYIGYIFLASIMCLVTMRAKIMGFIFFLVSTLLMIVCFDNIAVTSNLIWIGVLYGVLDLVLLVLMLHD